MSSFTGWQVGDAHNSRLRSPAQEMVQRVGRVSRSRMLETYTRLAVSSAVGLTPVPA